MSREPWHGPLYSRALARLETVTGLEPRVVEALVAARDGQWAHIVVGLHRWDDRGRPGDDELGQAYLALEELAR